MGKIGNLQTVWGETEETRNVELCFSCQIAALEDAKMLLVAKDLYNLFINGRFVAYGPSRAAKGYNRVERLDIGAYLTEKENEVAVYVQSNGTDTLAFAREAPVFGACILSGGQTVRQTADFRCFRMTDKLCRVERMSSQRGFLEVYAMQRDRGHVGGSAFQPIGTKPVPCPRLLERGVCYADNAVKIAACIQNAAAYPDVPAHWENDLTRLLDSGTALDSFARSECECVLSRELLSFRFDEPKEARRRLQAPIYAFSRVYSGKFRIRIRALQKTSLWLIYDDLLTDGGVSFNREQIIHGLKWTLEAGEYTLYSQEVYSAKYLRLVLDGEAELREVAVVCIENPDAGKFPVPPMDAALQTIVRAARNTFTQNAYDIFTDCPSRERAGWLCDSYFLGKAERFFTGQNRVERCFLENYLLYENEVFAHPGILPMCYPSNVRDRNSYIPNWILWYVLELEDYLRRSGDTEFLALHRHRLREILAFFQSYENELGLLENLEGWFFVEWSGANDYTQGVNFPSNMLYADALRAAGVLLHDGVLVQKSEALKARIRELSYNGEVFFDQAVRRDGVLRRTENLSELCQIFAAYFQIAEPDAGFYENFKNRFRGSRYQEVMAPSALFIGGIVRLFVLYRMGEYSLLLTECKEKFLPMAERTGTIWEFYDDSASCNHGFGAVLGALICKSAEKIKKGA